MAGNYTALTTLWNSLPSGLTTGEKLQLVNAAMTPGPSVDVNRVDVANTIGQATLAELAAFIANPPSGTATSTIAAANYLLAIVGYEATYSPKLQTSNATYLQAIQGLAPDLLLAGVSQAQLNAMMALITPLVTWYSQNGFSAPVYVFDLISAGNLY